MSSKPWYKRWWAIILFIFIGLLILGLFLPDNSVTCNKPYILVGISCCLDANTNNICDNDESTIDSSGSQTQTSTQTTTPAVEEQTEKATIGEKNALSKALSYLRAMSFSYSGLVEQLEYEGYTHQEAVYGVDNCGADWNEQAALKAESYLDTMAFSKEGLIEQLEYEGFTREQAEYGVQAVGY